MFNFNEFDNVIFDMNKPLYSHCSQWFSERAEVLERTTGRPTFSCTKAQLRAEIATLNALLPTNKATLIANMVLIPSDYQDWVADALLGVK